MGAGGEVHFLHRVFEVAGAFGVDLAVDFHLARVHRRVGGIPGFAKALVLDLAGLHDTLADRLGLVSGGRIRG